MRFDQVIHGMTITDRRGRLDAEIRGIACDSRKVNPGDLFVALRGSGSDGHRFIADAVARGAIAVLAESWPEEAEKHGRGKPQVVLVHNTRRALALAAANFYEQPSRKLLVAGVTGTNGKTTVTYLLESVIRAASRSVGLVGTVGCRYAGKTVPIDHTTPDPLVLQRLLRDMLDHGVTHVVMEVSSHALDQHRVDGVHFKVAGFTNLTQDHLDYHRDLEGYFQAKRLLFSDILRKSRARGRMAVVNVDDPRGKDLIETWSGKSLRVSLDPKADADVGALSAAYSLNGTKATVRTPKGVWELESNLIGPYNLSNVLVAIGMALSMGFSKARILRGIKNLAAVPGRLERVPSKDHKRVFVDYAHTPDALSRVLAALRPLVGGRIIVVFGCGGDRDKTKRPLMGRAVAEGADLAIVTNDNPRTEDPAAIARAVEEGLKQGGFELLEGQPRLRTYKVELDRRAAIRAAIAWLGPEDVLLIAGKGHETYQTQGREKRHFDDREEAHLALEGLPPPPPEVLSFTDSTGEIDEDQLIESVDEVNSKRRTLVAARNPYEDPTEEVNADEIEIDGTAEVSAEDIEAIVESTTNKPQIASIAEAQTERKAEGSSEKPPPEEGKQ